VDEIGMFTALRPPPGPQDVSGARDRLTATITDAPARRRARRTRGRAVLPAGIAVAAAAGSVVLTLALTGVLGTAPARSTGATPGGVRNAILTAFNGVGGDVFYAKITEIYPGKKSRWNDVQQNWSYPIQPQAGQKVHIRSVVVPNNPKDKGDTEYIYTQPAGAKAALPTKTEIIFVQYGNRTWSDTTAQVASQTPAASLHELRESIATGDFTAARKTELNGQTVLELTAHTDADKESVWVDPATYLPVRTLSDNAGVKIQVDYGFLPPTPANMAKLKATIPPGFTRTATIQTGP
jgi:outer membrane lipoprotein-sorting protein